MKVAIYARVSTKGQDSIEQQVQTCLDFCKMKGWVNADVFREKESSVKDRPVFTELLRLAKTGHYQTIVVFRLDRPWRKARQFVMDYAMLKDRGIKVVSVMEGLDPTTPIGEATMTIIMALNQLERDNISMATKQRLDIIKNSKKLGRPKGSKDHNVRQRSGYLNRWAQLKGDKKVDRYKPETIDLKNYTK